MSKSTLNDYTTGEHLSYDIRFPIILSSRSHLTKLLVLSYHYKYGHSVSIENVKHKLREGFIILGLNQFLRKLTKNCMFCKKLKNKPLVQRMADLPSYRFSMPLRAFSKVGIDFAGPFHIKQQGRGKPRLKSYILVFSCLQTRAVHLEATESQDTDSVLQQSVQLLEDKEISDTELSNKGKTEIKRPYLHMTRLPDDELEGISTNPSTNPFISQLPDDLMDEVKIKPPRETFYTQRPYNLLKVHFCIYGIHYYAKRVCDSLFTRVDSLLDEMPQRSLENFADAFRRLISGIEQ